MTSLPLFTAPARFDSAEAALNQVQTIYKNSTEHLRHSLQRFVAGEAMGRVRAFYPFVRVTTSTVARADSRLSYGFVAGPGTYETTLTRPDLFASYYLEQFRLLLKNHGVGAGGGHQRCSRSRCTSRWPSTTTWKAAWRPSAGC